MSVPFLETIAKAYSDRYSDLSRHLFIFPNRRAGTFFMKNLMKCVGRRPMLLPKVTTMSDFVEELCGGVVAGRIEQLFVLYDSYVGMLRRQGAVHVPEFDTFRRWGETALSDFNEVDMQDVDADSIFKNVKDVKEISANFLTEAQMKVMEEFFGQAYDPEHIATEFWKNFNEVSGDAKESELKSRFRLLWQVLGPLYHSMHAELKKSGMFTSGGAYRYVASLLEEKGRDCIDACAVAMIGFNALTSTERRIFGALAAIEPQGQDFEKYLRPDDSFAAFFWDAAGPVITDKNSAAGRYVYSGIHRWPAPDWAFPYLAKSAVDEMPPDLKVISVPSNSMQTKVISGILENLANKIPQSDFKDAKVAVVLPDEGLLMPMLYSIPATIEDVNITMGYPLRLTATYTFVSLLRRLQSGRRKTRNDETGYYYKDLNLVLTHPYSHMLFGGNVSLAKEWIGEHHKSIVVIKDLARIDRKYAELLPPLSDDADGHEAAAWLDRILTAVADAMTDNLKDSVDLANINVYRLALSRLSDSVNEHGITMKWRTFFSLTDRLLSAETVNFEGQPLRGLQIMGLLETRALDFERVIVPSLNERILPMRRRARTFISDSLRKAYGLPPVNYAESLFAYYFYRMICRAKEVVLLYDGRASEGARSGDVSRYVLQLKFLYARNHMKMESYSFEMSKSDLQPSEIMKTREMMKMLEAFHIRRDGQRNLSATALMSYASCQIRFYFEHVLHIRTDEEATEYIDVMTQGSVIHEVMQNIYLPDEKMQKRLLKHPQILDEALIRARIKDTALIDRLITRAINRLHHHLDEKDLDRQLEGASKYVARAMRNQVLGILKFDLEQAPITLYGVEIEGNVAVGMPDGREINMRYAIDRIDSPSDMKDREGKDLLRIVDYKTGSVHNESESIQDVFDGDYHGRNLLQLWLYANLFDALPDKYSTSKERQILSLFGDDAGLPHEPYRLELYDVSCMSKKVHNLPKLNEEVQEDHTACNSEFLQLLENMLTDIFDESVPFSPAADWKSCKICPFKTICHRTSRIEESASSDTLNSFICNENT